MNTACKSFCTFFILLTCCFYSHSQTDTIISKINNYCDSIDKLKEFQTIIKAGAGVTLQYFISNEEVIKIIEQPSGYKYISAKETYYFQNHKPVYVSADVEISNEDGDRLTIELHKIYIAEKVIRHLISKEVFNADSLYSNGSAPLKTATGIRVNARFESQSIDHQFEKTLLQAIDKYLTAISAKDGDPVFDDLYSPFI